MNGKEKIVCLVCMTKGKLERAVVGGIISTIQAQDARQLLDLALQLELHAYFTIQDIPET